PAIAAAEVPASPAADPIGENRPQVAEDPAAVSEETEILEVPMGAGPAAVALAETAAADDVLAQEDDPDVPLASMPPTLADAAIRGEDTGRLPVQGDGDARLVMAASSVADTTVSSEEAPVPAVVSRGLIANLRKCEACGFPVSEGRQLCLDCEKKAKAPGTPPAAKTPASSPQSASRVVASTPPAPDVAADELLRFLGAEEEEASWLATHKLMVVAMAVAVVGIVVVLLVR
ncbi:MAG: hypothetical protein WA628_21730, partial [Terriglobales bacterium]